MKFFPFVFVCALAFASCGSSKKNEGSGVDAIEPQEGNHNLGIAVQIDGSLKEWPEPLPGYSKEASLHFGLTNDNNFLYIAVACSDDRMQRKLLRAGMEIYISESGKKETLTGIAFPLPSTKTFVRPETNDQVTSEKSAKDYKAKQLDELTNARMFGFKKTADGVYQLNENNFKIASSEGDNDFFNIEYAIPVSELFVDPSTIMNRSIQVGFKINSLSNKENSGQSNSYAGSEAGRSGMRGGGMRGGGMRGGGMRSGGMSRRQGGRQGANGMSDISKEQSFWTKYTISKK